MKCKQSKLQVALIVLSLIGGAIFQPAVGVQDTDSTGSKNNRLENVEELRNALRTIETFIETEENADVLQEGKNFWTKCACIYITIAITSRQSVQHCGTKLFLILQNV